ncbi:MAG: NADH-quinone oxidoreductase subunit C [Chloroflexota bacterium]
MSTETCLQAAASLLGAWAQETVEPEPGRADVVIAPGDLIAAAGALIGARWGYLTAITGLDLGPEDGRLEVLYHFACGAAVVTFRVRVPREGGAVPSLVGVIPSISFYERELMEMFGVTVEGTPNVDKLFLPEDWPDGVYPLRKDFSMEQLEKQAED